MASENVDLLVFFLPLPAFLPQFWPSRPRRSGRTPRGAGERATRTRAHMADSSGIKKEEEEEAAVGVGEEEEEGEEEAEGTDRGTSGREKGER